MQHSLDPLWCWRLLFKRVWVRSRCTRDITSNLATLSYSHVSGPACHLMTRQLCFENPSRKEWKGEKEVVCPKSSFVQAPKGITEGRTCQNVTNLSKEPTNRSLDGEATEWRLCQPSGCMLNTTSVKLTPTAD